jgi:hypothetical protein
MSPIAHLDVQSETRDAGMTRVMDSHAPFGGHLCGGSGGGRHDATQPRGDYEEENDVA